MGPYVMRLRTLFYRGSARKLSLKCNFPQMTRIEDPQIYAERNLRRSACLSICEDQRENYVWNSACRGVSYHLPLTTYYLPPLPAMDYRLIIIDYSLPYYLLLTTHHLLTTTYQLHIFLLYCPPTSNNAFVICPREHTLHASINTSKIFLFWTAAS